MYIPIPPPPYRASMFLSHRCSEVRPCGPFGAEILHVKSQVPTIDMTWPEDRAVDVMKAACLRTGFFYGEGLTNLTAGARSQFPMA